MKEVIAGFNKRDFIWIGLFVVLIGAGFGYALNSGNYQVMGHSLDELGLPSCLDGQMLIKNSSGWICADLPSSITPVSDNGCRLCVSCGGNWSVDAGWMEKLRGTTGLGAGCSGYYHNVGDPSMHLCCSQ